MLNKQYLLVAVLPLLILAVIFIFIGSFNVEKSIRKANTSETAVREAKSNNLNEDLLNDLEKENESNQYNASMYIFMLICAYVLIIHAMVIFNNKKTWGTAYASFFGSLAAFGILRKYYNMGNNGINNVMIYLFSAITFIILTLVATNKSHNLFTLTSSSSNDQEEDYE